MSIEKFAVWARKELIKEASKKYVSKKDNNSNVETSRIEEVAYTCFSRLIALRFMEANNYLPFQIRIFSDANNNFTTEPQILKEALNLNFKNIDKKKILTLFNKNKKIELYKYLIWAICNELNPALPIIFEEISSNTEIFLPDNILEPNGFVEKMLSEIPVEKWKNGIQIIGWLYQYYNSEVKIETYKQLKQNIKVTKERIPSVTQLFTPDWIVKYMVENSIGRKYIESIVKKTNISDEKVRIEKERQIANELGWKYYLPEAEQNQETRKLINTSIKESFNPKEIKIIDPCIGCGNILVYAFDLLVDIYEKYGYTKTEAVESIIKNNLYGLDIDKRVVQLAYFSIMMKARQYDNNILKKNLQPNIEHFQDLKQETENWKQKDNLLVLLKDADQFGSLIKIEEDIKPKIQALNENFSISDRVIRIINMLSQKYDVVITNPPYMGRSSMNQTLVSFMNENYPNTKTDLFSAFLEHGLDMTNPNGYSCMVTMQNWMFIPSFEKFRKQIINNNTIVALMHMENMIMGIAFGTAVSIFKKNKIPQYVGNYNYVKYSDIIDNKPFEFPVKKNRFENISAEKFNIIPGSPIAYWASEELLNAYKNGTIGEKYEATVGIQTNNNDKFLKYWFEVPINEIEFDKNKNGYKKIWYPHPKGGAFQKWYGNYDYVVNWQNDGEEIRKYNNSKLSIKKYNRNGICWSHTTNGAFSARIFNNNTIPNLENPVLFCEGKEQKYLLALLNTKVANYLLNMINSTMHYHIGDILHLPLIKTENTLKIEKLSDECVELVKKDWNNYEFSWNFTRHPLCKNKLSLSENYSNWEKEKDKRQLKLTKNEEYLNKIFIELYGLQKELTPKLEQKYLTIKKDSKEKIIKSFLSYVIGCIFGRYSIDTEGIAYAGGIFNFSNYINYTPIKNNIIIINENEYFENDIVKKIEEWLIITFGKENLEQNLRFIADALGNSASPKDVIRKYFINDFYSDHLKTYQKRPIYWLFDAGKNNSFKALIYIHRYNKELITDLINYVKEQQKNLQNKEILINKTLTTSENKKLKKEKEKIYNQIKELQIYEEKIQYHANNKLQIDLNDGIKNNYALFEDILANIK